jgi:hypothetical protein
VTASLAKRSLIRLGRGRAPWEALCRRAVVLWVKVKPIAKRFLAIVLARVVMSFLNRVWDHFVH